MLKFPIDRRMRLCLFHIFQQKRLNRFFFSFLASLIKNKNYIYPQGVKSSEAYSEASSFFFFFQCTPKQFSLFELPSLSLEYFLCSGKDNKE